MLLFGFDTETHVRQPGIAAPPLVCGSIARPEPGTETLLSRTGARLWFREHIKKSRIVGMFLAYDLCVMMADDPEIVEDVFRAADEGRLHDIAIREALLDIARGCHGIDPETGRKLDDDEGAYYPLHVLVMRYFGIDIKDSKKNPDTWRTRYHELEHVPLSDWPAEAADYPRRDARHTIDVFLAQEKQAEQEPNGGNLHAEADQVRASLALQLASLWGVRTEEAAVTALRSKVEREWNENRKKFQEFGIFRKDGTKDTKKLRELVTLAYNNDPPFTPPSAKNPEGQVATDRDTLADSGDPVLEDLAKAGKVDKYRSTYLPKIEQGIHVPINARFNPLVSTTRVSSDYQQLPQKGGIRECHRSRPGRVYCSVDYGGLELRTMAQRAIWEVGYSKMADALLAKEDVHSSAAATFLSETYASLLLKVKAKEPNAVSFRALAKIFNFGKGGGMGDAAMAYQARAKDNVKFCLLAKTCDKCGIERQPVKVQGKVKMVCAACVAVSKKYGSLWLEAWPEQKELFGIAKTLVRNGSLTDAMIPGANILRGLCGYTQWLNTPFQGLGAVGAKLATWRVAQEMYTNRRSPLYGSRLVLQVHDELIAELLFLSPWQLTDAAERMAEIMRQAMRETTPDLAGAIEADPALGFLLSKDLATVRNAAGLLLPQDSCAGSCGKLAPIDFDGSVFAHKTDKGEKCSASGTRYSRPLLLAA